MDIKVHEVPEGLLMRDAAQVAAGLQRWVPLGGVIAQAWSAAGRVVEADGLYPACQFDEAGLPLAQMRGLIAELRPVLSPAGIVGWLGTPCPALGGDRPADRLRATPEAVLDAARRHAAQRRAAA